MGHKALSAEAALFYSEGLVEAHNPKGEIFGFPRLQAFVAEHGEERSLGDFLLEELDYFVGGTGSRTTKSPSSRYDALLHEAEHQRIPYKPLILVSPCDAHACINAATLFTTLRRRASRPLGASNDKPTGTLPEDSATGSDTCGSRPIPATEVRESARE